MLAGIGAAVFPWNKLIVHAFSYRALSHHVATCEWSSRVNASKFLQNYLAHPMLVCETIGFLSLRLDVYSSFFTFFGTSLAWWYALWSCDRPCRTPQKVIVRTSNLSMFSLRASSERITQIPQSQYTIPSIKCFIPWGHWFFFGRGARIEKTQAGRWPWTLCEMRLWSAAWGDEKRGQHDEHREWRDAWKQPRMQWILQRQQAFSHARSPWVLQAKKAKETAGHNSKPATCPEGCICFDSSLTGVYGELLCTSAINAFFDEAQIACTSLPIFLVLLSVFMWNI